MSLKRLQGVLKTSRKTKNCYAEDLLTTSSRRPEDQQMFTGKIPTVLTDFNKKLRDINNKVTPYNTKNVRVKIKLEEHTSFC